MFYFLGLLIISLDDIQDLLITLIYLDFLFSRMVMALSNISYIFKMKSSMLQVVTSGVFFCFAFDNSVC